MSVLNDTNGGDRDVRDQCALQQTLASTVNVPHVPAPAVG